ncbi:MAG: xylulokinase [Sedimentisphaerales bacterium]
MYLIGYDIGTSSIKATLLDSDTGSAVASAVSPKKEMAIIAHHSGWAEQDPQCWWDNLKAATMEMLAKAKVAASDIKAVGISYQMHGLVCVNKQLEVIRPSIIWCDSRAVAIGEQAAAKLGDKRCLESLLNLPGNFTAAKLKWVMDNEPQNYKKIYKIMLPGDYIAARLTGKAATTASGLSECMFWDFKNKAPAEFLIDHFGFSPALLAELVPTFGVQGELTKQAAEELGLKAGTVVSYRAGDQPNNAFSLNVLKPGEIAATAGTSGVVYGIGDKLNYDLKSRVNTFAHVNSTSQTPRYGVLLCVNGAGILNSWLKRTVAAGLDYDQMNRCAAETPIGSNGLVILPYGNGAERTLANRNIGAHIHNLNFNTHTVSHLLRAGQEGIVFALHYGIEIMRTMGIEIKTVRAGDANMFISPLFGQAFASVTGAVVELYNTDGAQGAARGAGIGAGVYKDFADAFIGLKAARVIEPVQQLVPAYRQAYEQWLAVLESQLAGK